MAIDLKTIDAREKAIADQMAALQRELEDLAAAKRVVGRLSGPPETVIGRIVREQIIEADKTGKPRPAGTPTNLEMAEFVLASAEKEGKDGLTASELVQAIGARYWPGLVGKQILPSIYEIAKKGRLKKTANGKFKRVKKADAGD
ncbi:MAG TPA: hypothetical protein VFC54_08085 [Pseudolabrys sp.]|nr:hypothetical protein [Pseudolabrys sp.]